MKPSGSLTQKLANIASEASTLEQQGAEIGGTLEIGHDPLMQLAIAATSTERMQLMTSIAVAFGRSARTS